MAIEDELEGSVHEYFEGASFGGGVYVATCRSCKALVLGSRSKPANLVEHLTWHIEVVGDTLVRVENVPYVPNKDSLNPYVFKKYTGPTLGTTSNWYMDH